MTLQSLGKYLDKYDQQLSSAAAKQLELLKGLPFYNWPLLQKLPVTGSYQQEGQDIKTFNHAIGLPQKNGQPFPLFDYEQMLFDILQANKHIWIKKATGLGVTEFMLRYMAWLCFSDKNIGNSQMCIVTGPRIELAITLIDRMKAQFSTSNDRKIAKERAIFDSKETVIELNGVHIEAYPSHHLDAMRGLDKVAFIYLDEADFFPPGQQQDARDVRERYIAKSNPWIVMVSTPNAPEGLFERIEKEHANTCLYHRLFLDYTYGLGKIYTAEEIQQAKASPSFEREYNLKYLGLVGNVFHTKDIEAAIERGRKFSVTENSYTQKSVGLDPGFGSSAFGVCITELRDGVINVLHAEEYPRPDFNEMIETTLRLLQEYDITFENRCRVFVDGANPSFIRALKDRIIGETVDYERLVAHFKTSYGSNFGLHSLIYNMFVVPIHFSKEHKNMLAHAKRLLEYGTGAIAIHPQRHSKLITALRTAVEKGDGALDKDATSHDDLFDSFRMSLQYWH